MNSAVMNRPHIRRIRIRKNKNKINVISISFCSCTRNLFKFVDGFKINERHVSEKPSENETKDKIMERLFQTQIDCLKKTVIHEHWPIPNSFFCNILNNFC